MAIQHITDQGFDTSVSEGVTLIDFWAPWCGPCRMIAPVLEEIDTEIGDQVQILKMNVDEQQITPTKFGIMSIPTLLLFKDGEVVETISGYQPKEALTEVISQHI